MILINQFPDTRGNSMYDLLPDLRCAEGMDMKICWFYSLEGALNVAIKMKDETHNSFLAAWLTVKGYLFSLEEDEKCFERATYQNYYVLNPIIGSRIPDNATPILCAGLLKTEGGRLTMEVHATSDILTHSAILETDTDNGVREISYALGAQAYISQMRQPSWHNTDPRALLMLPNSDPGLVALTSGYGLGQTSATYSDTEVILGSIYNDILNRKICLTKDNITNSTAIFGSPGYGKSTMIQSIIWQMWTKHGIPFVIIEPKHDYQRMKSLIPELTIWTSKTLARCNPLAPPFKMSYEDYVDVALELIELITPSSQESSHRDYFRDAYFLCLKETGRVTVPDFLSAYDKLMQGRFRGEALNFVAAGRHKLVTFFTAWAGPNFMTEIREGRISFEKHLNAPMVIEVGDVATLKLRSALAYYILQHIRGTVKDRVCHEIKNLLILEEAHMLLDPSSPIEIRREIGNGLAEDRARGLSFIILDQSPSRLDMTQVGLAGNIISFRMTSDADRSPIAEQLGISTEALNNMQKRQVWCRTNVMYSAAKVKVEVSDEILGI